jgi:hypothetical protein
MTMLKTLVVVGALTAVAATYARMAPPPAKPVVVAALVAPLPPLRVAVFVDKSFSTTTARIADPSISTFEPLFDRLRATGGEIAFGLVRDHSNRPLIRVYMPAPPDPPGSAPPVPGNIFVAANTKKREDAERKKNEAARQAWLADATARIKAFIAAVTPLLATPDDAMWTDVRSAIERADLFLAEPSPFARTPECVVVLVSDAIDNVTAKPVASLKSNARVVIANGIGSVGSVEALSPVRFEAVAAAMRYAAGGQHDR